MEAYGLGDEDANPGSKFAAKANQLKIRILDRLSPQVTLRWLIWAGLLVSFALRIWFVKGFYIVAYALGIFNLNLLLGFLSPQARASTAHPSPDFRPPVDSSDGTPTNHAAGNVLSLRHGARQMLRRLVMWRCRLIQSSKGRCSLRRTRSSAHSCAGYQNSSSGAPAASLYANSQLLIACCSSSDLRVDLCISLHVCPCCPCAGTG